MEEYTHEQIHYAQDTGMLLQVCEHTGTFTAKHWHNGFEILYVVEGQMTVNTDGVDHIIRPGGFAVINCKSIHSAKNTGYCRNLLLQIPYDKIVKNIPDIDTSIIRCICKCGNSATGKYAEIKAILTRLENLFESEHDCGYLLKLNSLVYELLYQLVMNFKIRINPELKKKTDHNIQRLGIVLQYVRQHYAENISLSDAASIVALNKEYFSRFFRKYMGMTFMDYVFSIRLEHAHYDIINTDYTINEIASRCGFEKNYRLFVSKFREQYGCNPAQKRSQTAKHQE